MSSLNFVFSLRVYNFNSCFLQVSVLKSLLVNSLTFPTVQLCYLYRWAHNTSSCKPQMRTCPELGELNFLLNISETAWLKSKIIWVTLVHFILTSAGRFIMGTLVSEITEICSHSLYSNFFLWQLDPILHHFPKYNFLLVWYKIGENSALFRAIWVEEHCIKHW